MKKLLDILWNAKCQFTKDVWFCKQTFSTAWYFWDNPQPKIILVHLFSRHILLEMDITCLPCALVTLEDGLMCTNPCRIHTSTIKDGCGWTGVVNTSRRSVKCCRFFQVGVSWRGELLVDATPMDFDCRIAWSEKEPMMALRCLRPLFRSKQMQCSKWFHFFSWSLWSL